MSLPSSAASPLLPDSLLDRVLEKLEIARAKPTSGLLSALYGSWCQKVPFDNVRKLIHMRAASSAPLPGSTPEDYLEAWLSHGTGGTCWSGAGALHAVLGSLGFQAERGIATMLVYPTLPPNHGTVVVTHEEGRFLVDTSILYGEPLRLEPGLGAAIDHPAWGVRTVWRDDRCHIQWRPLHKTDGFECRIESTGASAEEYRRRYDHTRGWSPFNYELVARTNRHGQVIGAAYGQSVTLLKDGSVATRPISQDERTRLLIEDFGMSEEIVSQLPADTPTPPPPGSKTAGEAG